MPVSRPSFNIGIEEEYQTIDPSTRDLRSHIHAEILEKGRLVLHERIKPEMHQSVVEIGTGVCSNIQEAKDEIRSIRREMIRLARDNGLMLAAGGTHPFAQWNKQEIYPDERYRTIVEDLKMVARANLIFGLHVHIGVEDRETAIQLMNSARYFLPHLLALSANSPFWMGMETGLRSYRCKVFDKFPRTNIPDLFASWSEFENYVNLLVHTNCIDNAKKIWWDIRPHPYFPTLEFRVCDIPMRLDETIAIAALCQAIIATLYKLHERNLSFRQYSRALIMENKWRAARYGLEGKMIDFGKQTEVPARDLIREILDFVSDTAEELGSTSELSYIHRILEEGNGAERQLRVFAETNDLKKVVDYMVQETESGLGEPRGVGCECAAVSAGVEFLRGIPFDASLTPGARNAVEACLRIRPEERVTLITDLACAEIGAALAHEVERLGRDYNAFVLEHLAARPLIEMPAEVLADMELSQVSIFAVKAQANELHTRMQMTDVVNARKMRHAHMVNIDRRIMLEGMRADFEEVDRISTQVWQMASAAREIRATNPAGTEIVGRFSARLKWLKTSGIISPHKWGNLPGGETFTTPEQVDGTFVIDGVVGDYLCEKYGDLRETPLTVRIEGNRLREAYSANRELEDEFWRYCHTDENSDRVGEFAIGTNIGVRDVIGNILQDEKIPGIHVAFGNPYGAHTGADWYSGTHIDVVGRKFDIWIDGRQIMAGGAFLLDSLTPEVV